MRLIPHLALLAVAALVLGGYLLFGTRESTPSRDFLELELAAADPGQTGTCYSLATVLIANKLDFGNEVISWHRVDRDTWTRRSEDMVQGARGPTHVWQSFTFRREDARIIPLAHDSAPDEPASLESAIDRLLEAPIDRRSSRVDRCRDGGSGYQPKKSSAAR